MVTSVDIMWQMVRIMLIWKVAPVPVISLLLVLHAGQEPAGGVVTVSHVTHSHGFSEDTYRAILLHDCMFDNLSAWEKSVIQLT